MAAPETSKSLEEVINNHFYLEQNERQKRRECLVDGLSKLWQPMRINGVLTQSEVFERFTENEGEPSFIKIFRIGGPGQDPDTGKFPEAYLGYSIDGPAIFWADAKSGPYIIPLEQNEYNVISDGEFERTDKARNLKLRDFNIPPVEDMVRRLVEVGNGMNQVVAEYLAKKQFI
jgi:hypothetical protein